MTGLVRYGVMALFAFAGAVLIQILAVGSLAYPNLWVLPATFIAATTLVLVTGRRPDTFPWLEYGLMAMWFVRLVVIPWLMVTSGTSYLAIRPFPTVDEYRRGVMYMAYEVLVTALVLVLVRAYLGRSSRHPVTDRGADLRSLTTTISFRPGSYVPQGLLMVVGAASLAFAGVRERFSFFTSTITGTAREIVSRYDSSFDALANVANLSRLAVPGVLITLALRAYRRRPSMMYPLLAMGGCVVVNLFYVATSRASFFVPLAAAIIVLAMAFPVGRSLILVCAGSALLLATIVVTDNKSFSTSAQSTLGDMANYLSTYLMGPKEYAIGIRAVNDYGSSADGTTLVGDFLGNIPVLSTLVDPFNRTSQFYNWTYLGGNVGIGGGYIAPASIQSAFYVGWIFGPLATALGLISAVLGLRYLRGREQDPSLSYVAAFAVVVGLLFHTNTVSTFAAFLAFPIIPLIVLSRFDALIARSSRGGARKDERNSYRWT